MKKVIKRMKKPTPVFFKKLRNIGLSLAAVSTSVFAVPVALPVIITKIAGYIAVAGAVAGSVSQVAIKNEKK